MRSHYDVILAPVVSEKSSALAEVASAYVFKVAFQANKYEIRDAVQALFDVKVSSVHTLVVQGKLSNWKKAIVTLVKGQKIDLFKLK